MLVRDFSLQWHLTEKCNLRCKHCYQNLTYLKQEISFKKKISLLERIVKFCKLIKKRPRIAFTGGEPFAIKRELKQILEWCNKKHPEIKLSILSNGVLIGGEDISYLKKLKNLEYIQISLEGLKERNDFIRGSGVFKKAVDTIGKLKENSIKVAVMCTLTRLNYDDVIPLINFCEKLGVDYFGIDRIVPEGEGSNLKTFMVSPLELKEIYYKIALKQKEFIEEGKKLKIVMKRPLWCLIKEEYKNELKDLDIGGACAAAFNGLTIMPNGDIMPCRRMDMVIGNAIKQELIDIWYGSEVLWNLRERMGECSSCEYKNKCYGCRAIAKAIKGNYLAKDVQCWK